MRVAVVGAGSSGRLGARYFLAHGLEVAATDPDAAARGAPAARRRPGTADVGAARPGRRRLRRPDRLHHRSRRRGRRRRLRAGERPGASRGQGRDVRGARRCWCLPTWWWRAAPRACCRAGWPRVRAAHPERVLVGHPFNPPHLVPLVEVVRGRRHPGGGGRRGDGVLRRRSAATGAACARAPGPPRQPAAGRALARGVLAGGARHRDRRRRRHRDREGPGLRWALLGPVANQHLSGGDGGLAHVLEHLGPARGAEGRPGRRHACPRARRCAGGRRRRGLAGLDMAALAAERDALLVGLLTAKSSAKGLP